MATNESPNEPPRKRQRLSICTNTHHRQSTMVDNNHNNDYNHNHNHNTNNNQQNHNNQTVQNQQTFPEQLRRKKPRKKIPVGDKINDIIKKCRENMIYLQLVKVICIDDEKMEWWHCTNCTVANNKKKLVKYVDVRAITNHLKSSLHHKNLSDDLKKLDNDREEKEQIKKKKQMN